MRFLIDNALSPFLALILESEGHVAVHVRDCGMQDAEDQRIFDFAAENDMVIISADTDFGTLLALWNHPKPSVILFRGGFPRRPERQAALLVKNLPSVAKALEKGAITTFEANRIRIRNLPIGSMGELMQINL